MRLYQWWYVVMIAWASALGLASVESIRTRAGGGPLPEHEQHVWTSAVHDSEFATLSRAATHSACAAAQPPQALATPDPLLEDAEENSRVSVSFIIGTDGRVHSALILESAGPYEDRTVLRAVRFWRYRPALCNGVPTDSEAKVEFSSH